jgi:hypothetical protein
MALALKAEHFPQRVKTGKAHCEHSFSALAPKQDVAQQRRMSVSCHEETFAEQRARSASIVAVPVRWPGAIGCSDQCLRNFPLAIRSRAAICGRGEKFDDH